MKEHVAPIAALALAPGEALLVSDEGVALLAHCSRPREDGLLLLLTSLARMVDVESRRETIDLDPLPPRLRALIEPYRALVEAHEDRRLDLTREMSRDERDRFLAAITPLSAEIETYLDARGASDAPDAPDARDDRHLPAAKALRTSVQLGETFAGNTRRQPEAGGLARTGRAPARASRDAGNAPVHWPQRLLHRIRPLA